MNNKMSERVGVVCVAEPRLSLFPDLMPFETCLFAPSQRRAKGQVDQVWAMCKKYLASLPQFEFFVFVSMMMLASA